MNRQKDYTYRSMHEERKTGVYWYSVAWQVLRPVLVGILSVLITVGLLASAWNHVYTGYIAPVDPHSTEDITFEVKSGQSLSRISANLEEAGLIRSHTVFKYYCDFSGFSQKLQTGTYTLSPTMTLRQIVDRITSGDGKALVTNITMIPGWTIRDLADYLVTKGLLTDRESFLSLCADGRSFREYHYIADVLDEGNAAQRIFALEGYLSPNTYEVYTSASPEELIRRLLSQTETLFSEEYTARAAELGLTMDEVITLASMIEKEAKTGDFARVSAVFHNRLKARMPLQSDVTIHYVTGVRKMDLSAGDLAISSPYNTYVVKGLPAGPICSPSQAAVYAALYPDESFRAGNYLYFCAKDPASGELYFSRTQKEHDAAVKVYAPLWKQYDKERGIE